MPNDRAAVAREATLRLVDEFEDAGTLLPGQVSVLREYIEREHPAPPAPETVTVTVGGRVWAREVDGWWVHHSDTSHDVCGPRSTIGEMCDRIASDARVLKERDARIAELETQLQRALDGAVFHEKRAHHAEQERDAARVRIAELEQLLQDQPRLLYDSMWQAIDRMGDAVGTLTGPGSNCHVTATRVCETIETLKSERDAALRALEEVKHPVATRETVERVVTILRKQAWSSVPFTHRAEEILTAAGFTVQEGA